jgi:hypothetical protein
MWRGGWQGADRASSGPGMTRYPWLRHRPGSLWQKFHPGTVMADRTPLLGQTFTRGLVCRVWDLDRAVDDRRPAITVSSCISCRSRRRPPASLAVVVFVRLIGAWLVAGATQHRKVRIAREPGVCHRPLAEAERGSASGLDLARVPAGAAQARRRARRANFERGRRAVSHRFEVWRRGWDSNPRSLSTLRFSRAPPSTARPPLRARG